MNKTMYLTHRTVSKLILLDKSNGTVCLGESMLILSSNTWGVKMVIIYTYKLT